MLSFTVNLYLAINGAHLLPFGSRFLIQVSLPNTIFVAFQKVEGLKQVVYSIDEEAKINAFVN